MIRLFCHRIDQQNNFFKFGVQESIKPFKLNVLTLMKMDFPSCSRFWNNLHVHFVHEISLNLKHGA